MSEESTTTTWGGMFGNALKFAIVGVIAAAVVGPGASALGNSLGENAIGSTLKSVGTTVVDWGAKAAQTVGLEKVSGTTATLVGAGAIGGILGMLTGMGGGKPGEADQAAKMQSDLDAIKKAIAAAQYNTQPPPARPVPPKGRGNGYS